MKSNQREQLCFMIGIITTVFFSSLISLIIAAINNNYIYMYVSASWMIISGISYFICLHYLDKKTEEEINLI